MNRKPVVLREGEFDLVEREKPARDGCLRFMTCFDRFLQLFLALASLIDSRRDASLID